MSTSSPSRTSQAKAKMRRRRACKQCRQAKVRCEMEQPPCARCIEKHHACEYDPRFRRRRNHERFQELEAEVRMLRQGALAEIGIEPAARSNAGPASVTERRESPRESTADERATSTRVHDAGIEQFSVDRDTAPRDTAFVVRNVKLTFETASRLYTKYFEGYHGHLPFLEPSRSMEECYQRSEVLFWAIMSVAAREQQPVEDFLPQLALYFNESLGTTIMGGVMSLGHVQALLLVSLWPPSNVMLWSDRSMTWASIAVTGALYLGLHLPALEEEYVNHIAYTFDVDKNERARLWIACISVAQNLAMDSGLPLQLPFAKAELEAIPTVGSALDIPIDLQHYFVIQKYAYNTFAGFPERSTTSTSATYDNALLIQLVKADTDLQRLLDTCLKDMSLLNRLRFATVQLYVRCMHFNLKLSHSERRQGVLNAYNTAAYIIDTAVSEIDTGEVLSNSPRTTFRMLLLAACVICKVLHSSAGSEVDFNYSRILFNSALLCMRQQAVYYKDSKDMPIRCVDFLREIWHLSELHPSLRSSEPELVVQSKSGASVVYHYLAVFFDRMALYHQQRDRSSLDRARDQPLLHHGDFGDGNNMDSQLIFAQFKPDFAWALDVYQDYSGVTGW